MIKINSIDVKESFLTVREFSKVLRVHPNTILTNIRNGRIHAFRTGAGKRSSYRIPKSEIHRLAVVDLEEIVDNIMRERERK